MRLLGSVSDQTFKTRRSLLAMCQLLTDPRAGERLASAVIGKSRSTRVVWDNSLVSRDIRQKWPPCAATDSSRSQTPVQFLDAGRLRTRFFESLDLLVEGA